MNIPNNVKAYYTEKEFEEIQANFNGKAEYENMYLKGSKCRAYDEQIEVIFKNESELHKYKPDVFVMCDNPEKQGESFLSPPKIIFEVISRSTANHDYITKLYVYQKFGVLEYNIVEQNGFIVQYTLIEGQYQITNTFKGEEIYTSTIFKDLSINLKDIFE